MKPVFWIKESELNWKTENAHDINNFGSEQSKFDELLKTSWMEAQNSSALNYEVNSIPTKVLPGQFRIVTQLNPVRKEKRRTPESIESIKQPFDCKKFNFNKVSEKEILFEIFLSDDLLFNEEENTKEEVKATVIVNTAPITTFHSLLVPSRESCQPQVLDYKGILFGIMSVLSSRTPALKVGFNSLGGMASVNHYHFHMYYIPYSLFVETAACVKRAGPLYIFEDHYAPGFVFQLEGVDIKTLARNCSTLIKFLLDNEVCHNVMITRGTATEPEPGYSEEFSYNTVRICIWIRKPSFGIKEVTGYASALCEFSGHLPVYDEKTWEEITEEEVAKSLREVCVETFERFLPKVEDLFAGKQLAT